MPFPKDDATPPVTKIYFPYPFLTPFTQYGIVKFSS